MGGVSSETILRRQEEYLAWIPKLHELAYAASTHEWNYQYAGFVVSALASARGFPGAFWVPGGGRAGRGARQEIRPSGSLIWYPAPASRQSGCRLARQREARSTALLLGPVDIHPSSQTTAASATAASSRRCAARRAKSTPALLARLSLHSRRSGRSASKRECQQALASETQQRVFSAE